MAGRGRGFAKERHARLKAGVTVLAVAGFAAGWAGFAANHEGEPATATATATGTVSGSATATSTPSASRTVTPTATAAANDTPRTGGPLPTVIPAASATPGALPTTAAADDTPKPAVATPTRARRSRGS
ncbi:MAG: hypothetical protein U0547_03815 [Dehalococcoidia bacterium]